MGHYLAILLLWFNPPHGDLDQRIADLCDAIRQYPDSTQLYLERGEVYVLHEDYSLAMADFQKCQSAGIANARVYAGLGRCYFASVQADSSLHYFDLALQQDPDLFSVKESKARLMALMQQPCAGAMLYDDILREATQPGPSLFIDASRMWIQCDEPQSQANTIQTLEVGIERLGSLHVLLKEMVQRYVEQHNYDQALQWQNKLVATSSSPAPLLDRAQLNIQAGNMDAARLDVQIALDIIKTTPAHRQSTTAFQHLRSRADAIMKQLDP